MTAESQPLRPEHEEMLRAIVTGERQTDDAEVQAATAEDAEFASRLAELQAAHADVHGVPRGGLQRQRGRSCSAGRRACHRLRRHGRDRR